MGQSTPTFCKRICFKLFILTVGRDAKTLVMSANDISSHLQKLSLTSIEVRFFMGEFRITGTFIGQSRTLRTRCQISVQGRNDKHVILLLLFFQNRTKFRLEFLFSSAALYLTT